MAALIDESSDDSTTCSVCLDIFRSPKVLPCGHSFCLEPCLVNLTNAKRHKKIHCPLCRSKVSLPKSGQAKDFPTNFSLQCILEARAREVASKRRNSEEETRKRPLEDPTPPPCIHLQTAEFYCERCEQFLCLKCAEIFHSSEGEHVIIAKDTALERARAQSENMVKDTITKMEQRIKRQSELLEEAKISSIDYDLRASCLQGEISRAMDSARRTIEEREQQYKQQINARADADKAVFNQMTRGWETAQASDKRILEQLNETLTKVQTGDLTSMDQVMSLGHIDVTCSAMVEQRNRSSRAPPFTLINGLPDGIPRLRQTYDDTGPPRFEDIIP